MTATDVEAIAAVLVCVGAFSFLSLVVCARMLSRRRAGAERRTAQPSLLEGSTPFIEMPHHLTTRQQMVDWMKHDLPQQTARLMLSDRD